MDLLLGFWRRPTDAAYAIALLRFYRAICCNSAEARGRRLLLHWLSAEQRVQFEEMKFFDVIGCNTGKRYRIHYGQVGNIREMDEAGNPTMGWCFVPKGNLVPGDVMLAQKIALETDELVALSVARRFPARPLPQSQMSATGGSSRTLEAGAIWGFFSPGG